jgi:type IV pilus assembly protein PilM
LSSAASLSERLFHLGLVRGLDRWLNAMPHPSLVVEIASAHVAVARWKANAGLEFAFSEPLPAGSLVPSPVEVNVAEPEAVRSVLRRLLARVPARGQGLTLLIPDPVVRVFIMPFESLPRRSDEAVALLRWRLKKSVPFDMDETVVSWMRQSGREENLEVITAVARQRIVREYEEIVESLDANATIVLSSTLSTLPLLEERGSTLLARLSGRTLTTVIAQGSSLCVYRSAEMPADAATLVPLAVMDEIFPTIAYYQDSWGGAIDRVRLSGFGAREGLFRQALADELKCSVGALSESDVASRMDSDAKDLMNEGYDALVGWAMNGGA